MIKFGSNQFFSVVKRCLRHHSFQNTVQVALPETCCTLHAQTFFYATYIQYVLLMQCLQAFANLLLIFECDEILTRTELSIKTCKERMLRPGSKFPLV